MLEYFDIDLTKASFEWDKEKNRMISARLATTSEKERYEHGEDDYE